MFFLIFSDSLLYLKNSPINADDNDEQHEVLSTDSTGAALFNDDNDDNDDTDDDNNDNVNDVDDDDKK